MLILYGDLLQLAADGVVDVLVHGCNCQCAMNAGFALAVRDRFPAAYEADLRTARGDRAKLGTISTADVMGDAGPLTIVNAYTQFHYAGHDVLAGYDAIRSAFGEVRQRFAGRRIGYPRLGVGPARGDWSIIAPILDEQLAGTSHALVLRPAARERRAKRRD